MESKDGGSLEAEVTLVFLGDLTDEALEWEFAYEEFSALLVLADFTESYGTWAIAMWLFDATGG